MKFSQLLVTAPQQIKTPAAAGDDQSTAKALREWASTLNPGSGRDEAPNRRQRDAVIFRADRLESLTRA